MRLNVLFTFFLGKNLSSFFDVLGNLVLFASPPAAAENHEVKERALCGMIMVKSGVYHSFSAARRPAHEVLASWPGLRRFTTKICCMLSMIRLRRTTNFRTRHGHLPNPCFAVAKFMSEALSP